ncbi:MAG: ATP-binding cassette subfamily B protein [Cellvibrionaceae bacterium]|jgi:ATP-binding cassette subfamily B protein
MSDLAHKKINPFKRLWHHAQAHRAALWWAVVNTIIFKLFDLAPPLLIGAAVDVVVSRQDSMIASFGVESLSSQLWILGGITALLWTGESIFDYINEFQWRNLAQTIQHDLRLDAYEHIQGIELAYFEDQSIGGLMSILNDDINQLERFLNQSANRVIGLIMTILVIGGTFIYIAPSVAWMALLPIPFVTWGSIRFTAILEPLYIKVREKVGMLNGQLANNLGGIATIKSFTAEKYEANRIRAFSDDYRLGNKDAITYSVLFVPLIRMFIMAGFVAIIVFGGQLALSGALNVGLYSVMVFMTQRLLWPLTYVGETLDQYQRAMASISRVMDLIEKEPLIKSGGLALPTDQVAGDVVFDNVSFHYHSNKAVSIIDGFSIHIPAGTMAAFVGPTGAGKSTLIKLILRFYDVTNGAIRLDGHELTELQTADLRAAVGLVSQDVFLFHGTVRENIAYGSFDSTLDEISAAAKVAEAHEFITQLPDGYETIVGERGIKLSGGQRQRISIARAVLKNPPILILDEATSAVDNETEAAIQRSLERIAVGRTTIVIAHRLSTVRNADQIIVLEQGRLKELGTHDELLNSTDGIYASLWKVQTGQR